MSKVYLHKASLSVDITSERSFEELEDMEIYDAVRTKMENTLKTPGRRLLEQIDLEESIALGDDLDDDLSDIIQPNGPGLGM